MLVCFQPPSSSQLPIQGVRHWRVHWSDPPICSNIVLTNVILETLLCWGALQPSRRVCTAVLSRCRRERECGSFMSSGARVGQVKINRCRRKVAPTSSGTPLEPTHRSQPFVGGSTWWIPATETDAFPAIHGGMRSVEKTHWWGAYRIFGWFATWFLASLWKVSSGLWAFYAWWTSNHWSWRLHPDYMPCWWWKRIQKIGVPGFQLECNYR